MRASMLHPLAAVGTLGLITSIFGCNEPTSVARQMATGNPSEALTKIQDDYVATPAGWYHRSCVHQIEDGARVGKGGLVRRKNGTTYQIPKCLYRRYPTQPGTQPSSPADTGWIEWADIFQPPGSWFQQLNASWTVPTVPLAPYSSEVYFSFPGLESNTFIIQPVIQFGVSGAGGGNFWGTASWHCDSGSNCIHSSLIHVAAGDAMYGTVAASNCANGNCVWTITAQDVTTGQRSILTVTDTQDYRVAVGGAVEVRGGGGRGISSCDQYPINGVFYSGLSVLDQNGTQQSPSWFGTIQSGTDPSCNFDTTFTTSSVSLYHNPCGPNCVTASGGLTAHGGNGLCSPGTITAVTASGSTAINLKDSCGNTGTMTLSGATASGGLTAHGGNGLCSPGSITAVTASGSSAINLKDSCGNTGIMTLSGATATGGLTAHGGNGLCSPGSITADTAWGANGFNLTDSCGNKGYVKLS